MLGLWSRGRSGVLVELVGSMKCEKGSGRKREMAGVLTNEIKLKKLTSNADRHSDAVLSAILFTGSSVPWLRIKLSIVLKAASADDTAFLPT